MSRLNISIDIVERDIILSNKIHRGIIDDMNKLFFLIINNTVKRLKNELRFFFEIQPTYKALVDGSLAGHFGFPIGTAKTRIDTIISTIMNNMDAQFKTFKKRGNNYSGGITIQLILSDYSDILSLPEAIVTTEKGEMLLWLDWLLKSGNRLIIADYDIQFSPGLGRSRQAIMIADTAKAWRVPPLYAGTARKNWLTKSIEDQNDAFRLYIKDILEQEVNARI